MSQGFNKRHMPAYNTHTHMVLHAQTLEDEGKMSRDGPWEGAGRYNRHQGSRAPTFYCIHFFAICNG